MAAVGFPLNTILLIRSVPYVERVLLTEEMRSVCSSQVGYTQGQVSEKSAIQAKGHPEIVAAIGILDTQGFFKEH